MKIEHVAALAAVALLAFHAGRAQALKKAAGADSYNQIQKTQDWWTFAGSWGM